MTVEEARRIARRTLSDERFYHTVCVAESARALAVRFGENPDRAEIAGLLHDIAKEFPKEDLLQMIRGSAIIDVDEILRCPSVWHAYAGGVYLRETLGTDDGIARAVGCHTTGKAGMRLLEKIVFLADYISADRDFDDLSDLRAKAENDLDGAVLTVLERQMEHLVKHRRFIDLNMVRAYNDLLPKGDGSGE